MTTARTEAQTDVAPLIPQSHGVKGAGFIEAIFMPIGNAIPMNPPIGKSITAAIKMRRGVTEAWKERMAKGVTKPKITRTHKRSNKREIPERKIRELSRFRVE